MFLLFLCIIPVEMGIFLVHVFCVLKVGYVIVNGECWIQRGHLTLAASNWSYDDELSSNIIKSTIAYFASIQSNADVDAGTNTAIRPAGEYTGRCRDVNLQNLYAIRHTTAGIAQSSLTVARIRKEKKKSGHCVAAPHK